MVKHFTIAYINKDLEMDFTEKFIMMEIITLEILSMINSKEFQKDII